MRLTTGANEVSIEVDEKVTLSTPYYLFQFTSSEKVSYYCIAENTSEIISRTDQFTITVTTDPDPLDGEVNLKPGTYHYKIYEQEDSENLDPTQTTTLLREGTCRVVTSTASTEYGGASITGSAYGG